MKITSFTTEKPKERCPLWRSIAFVLPALVMTLPALSALVACNAGSIGIADRDARIGRDAMAGDSGSSDARFHDSMVKPDASSYDSSGLDATQTDAAQQDAGPQDCRTLGCQANAYCDTATLTCKCLTGFEASGQNCVPVDPGDPAARTQSDMCTQWKNYHHTTASSIWTEGPNQCDLGTLSTEAIVDAISYVNGYRYLTGLHPLSDDSSLNEDAQYCAIIQYRQGSLNHHPPSSATCYTSQGASASASSDLALGTSTPASAIDLFMDDSGVSSLAHRRWIIYPSFGPAGVGFAGNATCLYVFSWQNSGNVEFEPWPNQGFTPMSVMPTTWSFSSNHYGISSSTQVAVKRLSDNADLGVDAQVLPSGFADPAIGFTPNGWTPQAGETYEVTVSALNNNQTVVYQVKPVTCP